MRGYGIPYELKSLKACDGFYVSNKAFKTDNCETRWEMAIDNICQKLTEKLPGLKKLCNWKAFNADRYYFVVLKNASVELIAEEADGFIMLYLIIPNDSSVPEYSRAFFEKYVSELKEVLLELYPGNVYKRINYRKLEAVEGKSTYDGK